MLPLVENGDHIGWFWTDPKVSVTFCKEDGVGLIDDEDGGEREAPAGLGGVVIAEAGVVEGDVDEDGLEVTAMLWRDGVGDAEFFRYGRTGVGE